MRLCNALGRAVASHRVVHLSPHDVDIGCGCSILSHPNPFVVKCNLCDSRTRGENKGASGRPEFFKP